MSGAELQLGQSVVAGAGLADAQAAGSIELQLSISLAVLGLLHQVLLADIDLGDIGDAAILHLAGGLGGGSGPAAGLSALGAAGVHLGQNLLDDAS